jgi:osmotically-inducible protein OsmY
LEEFAMKTLLMLALVLVGAVVAINYWNGAPLLSNPRAPHPVAAGTTGTVDVNAARERGADVGEKVAVAAAKIRDGAQEAALTSKIKAKMVLDDTIKARSIDVTTNGTTVTVSGVVRSVDEHDRAVRLARETAGVTHVVDRLKVESR